MILDYGYFRLAKRAAIESICYPKVGAVISNRRPISFGYNKPKSHPIYNNPEYTIRNTIHAEMDCIRFLTWEDLEDSTIWIYRENGLGNPALARPCSDCIVILRECHLRDMIYTIDEYPYYRAERL